MPLFLPAAVVFLAGGSGIRAGVRAGVRAVRPDEGGGVLGPAGHRLEPLAVDWVAGQLGGDDQLVFAGHVLGVVALDEPAAADRHQP